jgi:hypothetical protein
MYKLLRKSLSSLDQSFTRQCMCKGKDLKEKGFHRIRKLV